MTQESLDVVLGEAQGWTLGDWEQFRARMDEHFEQKCKAVELGEDGKRDIRRLIAMENDWPYVEETPRQTKMGF